MVIHIYRSDTQLARTPLLRNILTILALLFGSLILIGCAPAAIGTTDSTNDLEATITAKVVATITAEPEATPDDSLQIEGATVQSALDLYRAQNGSVAAQSTRTSDMTSSTPPLSPTYMRLRSTVCSYTWDSQGRTEQHC